MKISPSIASANPLRLEEELLRVSKTYEELHIDLEDGNFIPNITFGMKTVKALRSTTDLPFSFHLMVTNPYNYIEELVNLKPSIVFSQVESLDYPSEFIQEVKKQHVKVGLAFNPATPLEPYYYLLNKLDALLIMTSEPDGEDQIFIPDMLNKIKTLASKAPPQLEIWADGGIKKDYLPKLQDAGVTHVVMGREIFG